MVDTVAGPPLYSSVDKPINLSSITPAMTIVRERREESGEYKNVQTLIKFLSPQLLSTAASAGFICESFSSFVVLSLVEVI